MQPFYRDDAATIYNANAIDVYPLFEPDTFDLLFLDTPYYKVKKEAWDRQWDTAAQYLEWMGTHADQWQRILKPNGSLFVCASPQMVDSVKSILRERFHVLNTIRWYKPDGPYLKGVEGYRHYTETWEALVFCEQRGADNEYQGALVDENSTYWDACESAKRTIFGDYLRSEFKRAGVTNRKIAALFPSKTGGLTGCVSNWMLGYSCPTPEQYQAMREYLNNHDHGAEYLRTEYEELRTEYEELRRPFYPTREAFEDTWFYDYVGQYNGKHPCEKPIEMLRDVIQTTTRQDATIGDFFMGSGTTLAAGVALGRKVVGCDMSAHWCEWAQKRIETPPLFRTVEGQEQPEQLSF